MHQFTYQNTQQFYQNNGKGTAIILLHGFAEDGTVFNYQAQELQNNFRVIVPYIAGTFPSKKIEKEFVSLEDYADVLFALIQHLNISQCYVLGHSMGGYIALQFAKKYSNKLLGLGLIHSTTFADNEEKTVARKKGIELMNNYGVFSFLKQIIPNLFSKKFKEENAQTLQQIIDKTTPFNTSVCIQYYQAMMQREDTTYLLKTLTIPIFFAIGEEDTAAPMTDVLQQIHLPQKTYVAIYKNVAHTSMIENAAQLTNDINIFLTMM